jgi:hypothetical protein
MKKFKHSPRKKAIETTDAKERAFAESITFEEFLRKNANKEGLQGSEFRLVVFNELSDKELQIYCHPFGRDGETYDGYSHGFTIYPKKGIDNLVRYLGKINSPLTHK